MFLFVGLFFFLFVQSQCPTSGIIDFVQNVGCDSPTIFSLRVTFGQCYAASRSCKVTGSIFDCDGMDFQDCMNLQTCNTLSSFKIQNGKLMLYPTSKSCSGVSIPSLGCAYGAIGFGEYEQVNAILAVNQSACE